MYDCFVCMFMVDTHTRTAITTGTATTKTTQKETHTHTHTQNTGAPRRTPAQLRTTAPAHWRSHAPARRRTGALTHRRSHTSTPAYYQVPPWTGSALSKGGRPKYDRIRVETRFEPSSA